MEPTTSAMAQKQTPDESKALENTYLNSGKGFLVILVGKEALYSRRNHFEYQTLGQWLPIRDAVLRREFEQFVEDLGAAVRSESKLPTKNIIVTTDRGKQSLQEKYPNGNIREIPDHVKLVRASKPDGRFYEIFEDYVRVFRIAPRQVHGEDDNRGEQNEGIATSEQPVNVSLNDFRIPERDIPQQRFRWMSRFAPLFE